MSRYKEVGVGILFDLLEGRCDVAATVDRLADLLREHDPELDDFLRDLDDRRAERRASEDGTAGESAPGAIAPTAGDALAARPPGRLTLAVVPPAAGPAVPPDYTAALARVADRSADVEDWVAADAARARRGLRRLLDLSTAEERADAIRLSHTGMRSPALVEGLLDEAKSVRGAAPALALELTEAALLVAARVEPLARERSSRFRLVTRAEAHRANALRLLGELHAADSIWRVLAVRRARAPIDLPDEEAELLSLEASLRIDLRQFAQAETLLAGAEGIHRRLGDPVGQAKVLLKRGSAAEYAGDGERAIGFHQRAGSLLDPEVHPALVWASQHNLADTLVTLGRTAEAAAALAAHESIYERCDDLSVRLRRQWVEARIARAEERFDAAERGFAAVRNGWLSLQRPYDAALSTLDAAELHLARGNWQEVRRQAELLAPIFESRGVHREALAALLLFQQAARKERLTAAFLARLRRYLRLARNDPSFRFEAAPPRGRRRG